MKPQNISTALVGLIIVILVTGWIKSCIDVSIESPGTGSTVQVLNWKNRAGDSVTSIRATPDHFSVAPRRVIDSLANVYGVRERFLLEYIVALQRSVADVAPVDGSRVIDFMPADTGSNCPPAVKNMRQDFANPYYQVRAQIGDSSYLHLQAFDTLTAVWKKVKQGGLFNRKKLLQLDLSTANPYTRITGITAYRAPAAKPKKIGIGLQFGYGFQTGLKPQPYIGVGMSYNLIRL